MLNDARTQTEEMVSDNEIMQKAYEKANCAFAGCSEAGRRYRKQCGGGCGQIRSNAIRYTDEMLASLETIITRSLDTAEEHLTGLKSSLQDSRSIVQSNRFARQRLFRSRSRAKIALKTK